MADTISRAIAANPSELFLIEGHTAVGSEIDNLSIFDRRGEAGAVLGGQFGLPAENLTSRTDQLRQFCQMSCIV